MISFGKIPGAQAVKQGHAKDGEEESKEPEERAGIAEAEKEMAKGRQEKHGQNESRNLVVVGHRSYGAPSLLGGFQRSA
jgi:hypothetical protein